MSNTIPEKQPITTQPIQQPAAGAETPAKAQSPAVETPLFDNTTAAAEGTENLAGDSFTPSSNASVEELSAQKDAVVSNNAALEEKAETTQGAIDERTATIEEQTKAIDSLKETNAGLVAANRELFANLNAVRQDKTRVQGEIDNLEAQIKSAEGIVGGFINGIMGIFGFGEDVNNLKNQLAAKKAELRNIERTEKEYERQIKENGGIIAENNSEISETERSKKINEVVKTLQEKRLAEIQEMYKNGQLTAEQLDAAIDAAYEAAAEENGSTEPPSAEQKQGTTAAITDILTNGTLNTDSMNAIGNAITSQDTSTGRFDAEAFKPAYEAAGFEQDQIIIRLDMIQAIASYAEMGLNFDPMMLQNASVLQLDAMVETAMVQDVMRSTGKIIGSATNFTSKKDMQQYSETVDNFISTISTLDSYNKNENVNDLEVNSFLKLSNDKMSKISQGYVYSTSELEKMIGDADTMMTTLKTKASVNEAAGKSANTRFDESKNKTEGAIDDAEGQLGENDDDSKIREFRTEFLNLTRQYDNSDSDSAKQISIKAMENLYQRALKADEGVDKDPFKNNLYIAA